MIKTIYQFGEQLQKIEEMQHYFQVFAAAYPDRAENSKVLYAKIEHGRYVGVSITDYKKAQIGKYLFRELAGSNATSIVPTLHFYNIPISGDTAETIAKNEKELSISLDKFIGKFHRSLKANEKVYAAIFNLDELIDGLKKDLTGMASEFCTEKKNYLFTLQIDGRWLGEIPEIVKILEDEAYGKYFSNNGVAHEKVCALTYQKVEEVWGRVSTLGFTVNDISFSRNGFKSSDSYKMFPVSPDAVKILEGARRSLDDKFSYSFQSMKFFVLPRFVAINDEDIRLEVVQSYVNNVTKPKSAGETQIRAIVNREDVFASIIASDKLSRASLYYDIFFYEQKQAQFLIKAHVSDVLPSRFRKVIETKEFVEDFYKPLTQVVTKKETYSYFLTLNEIKKFFPDPFFFSIMEAVFYGTLIDQSQVIAAFMAVVSVDFKNKEETYKFPQSVKRTFAIYQYFQTLKLFGDMENQEHNVLQLSAENFVKQHAFFDTDLKKAAFYLGCAVEILLSSQRKHLSSEPFASKIHNLNVSHQEMKDIYHRLLNKGMEYKRAEKLYSTVEFDKYLRLVGTSMSIEDNTTRTDTSYAFALGLVMEKEFTSIRIQDIQAKHAAKSQSIAL